MEQGRPSEFESVYFAMLAEMGFAKHLGGQKATGELIDMCHINGDTYVLDVGCGVGITPCHIAKAYGCRVVGVDPREAMVRRARQRAEREGVGSLVEGRVADARDLPFDDRAFDVVICEAVLAFLPEREQVMAEFVRVTRPGGHVGIIEPTWIREPTPELRAQVTQSFGGNLDVQSPDEWQALLEAGGLNDVVARTNELTLGSEFSSRIKRLGGVKGMARLWARIPSVRIKRPIYRSFKDALAVPKEVMTYLGYGLYVGQR